MEDVGRVDVADVDQSTIEESVKFEHCEVVERLRSFDVAEVPSVDVKATVPRALPPGW